MFGPSYGEFVQGSALRTWNCVAHFANLLWYKFIHLRDPIMPRSRRRHHSRSRSRSRSHSHDRDREPKRRKIESYDSPNHKRSVSSEPEAIHSETDWKVEANLQNDLSESESPPQKMTENTKSKSENIDGQNDLKSQNENVKLIETMEELSNRDSNSETSEGDLVEPSTNTSNLVNSEIVESIKINDDLYMTQNNEANVETNETLEDVKTIEISDEQDDDQDIDQSDIMEDEEPMDVSDEENNKSATPSKLKEKANDLKITPKKVSSPKQIQKKLEYEKKRQEKQKEKEERERKRQEEKEEKERKRLEEKKRINEERLRLKQEKEEQKMKEKLAKEERKKKEQEEKDKKRREKEEKEEQKKKEREQEKLKKQQEIEEKNKEKQKLEEQKQKSAAAFANFFVSKKSDSIEEKKSEDPSNFMPFEVKSDMRLAPSFRRIFTDNDKLNFDEQLEKQGSNESYMSELERGKEIGQSEKTWPFEDVDPDDDDIVVVEENVGESIVEQKPKLEKMRAKFFKFHENQRPPYFGTFKKKSKTVGSRKPFGKDAIFNYEVDSDEEWEEEGEGESLKGTDDEEEKENESDHDYEVDNEFFVPHAYLSDDEVDDEANAKLSPESHKAKLKLLKNEFDEEMKCKTHRIKPRVIGCIWYNKTKSNVEDAIDRYLQPFAIICNGQIDIKKRSDLVLGSVKKAAKQLSKEHVPIFLKLIHGSMDKRKNIVKNFLEHMSNNGIQVDVSQFSLGRQLKNFAQWQKCPEEGVMHNKMCWYVGDDVRKEYNVVLTLPNKLNLKRSKTK